MPLPQELARFNKRFGNHILGPIVARLPGFAIVVHTGRKSGKTYRTPVNAFRTPTGYRVALTYGAETDWVRNVLAAEGAVLRVRGQRVATYNPRLGTDATNSWAPPAVRLILGRMGVTQYLDLTAASEA